MPAGNVTPVMRQYLELKRRYPDAILLFRMGDFYEMFYEDAVKAAPVLQIALTTRDRNKPDPIPMCGIPYHALDNYLARLIRHNLKVAICEQMEEPGKSRGPVRREVVRVVTPGTLVEQHLLEAGENNYIAALAPGEKGLGAAVLDISTAEFVVFEERGRRAEDAVAAFLNAFRPAELLLPDSIEEPEAVLERLGLPTDLLVDRREGWIFDPVDAENLLREHFGVGSLAGFGCEGKPLAMGAAGALLLHLRETQKASLEHIQSLRVHQPQDELILDPSTVRNLELLRTLVEGKREGTLLHLLDRTRTAMGARDLRAWLLHPLRDVERIRQRHDVVERLVRDAALRRAIRDTLQTINDIERLNSRIALGLAGPRDLAALRSSLEQLPHLAGLAQQLRRVAPAADLEPSIVLSPASSSPDAGETAAEAPDASAQTPSRSAPEIELPVADEELALLAEELGRALVDAPPPTLREGGVIRPGYCNELDELRELATNAKTFIANLQARERQRTGIEKLRIGFNRVFGYYIEVPKSAMDRVPDDYFRKQTLVNSERFVTPEIKEYEEKILGAEERIVKLEQELFSELRTHCARYGARLQAAARAVANLDVLTNLAEVAEAYGYARPEVYDGDEIIIQEGRHPVVERIQLREPYVPNETVLDNEKNQILVITGPNMAGKSTYIRQVALIVLMAQMGSFVPARKARIGVVDRIFTRVGATDNLYGGMSTFMVEMSETANILHNATPKSLIILDEIGRGTSTFDGLSIAWAVTEYLHEQRNVRAKTLFATHYHELTEVAGTLKRVKNYNVQVKEWNDTIVFLRKIRPGAADRSYGIQVARLAGLPRAVVERAKEILANLEEVEFDAEGRPLLARPKRTRRRRRSPSPRSEPSPVQLSLFAPRKHPVVSRLETIDPDSLTPRAALALLYELKELL
jgi:DNA mismatch repair protein MutS